MTNIYSESHEPKVGTKDHFYLMGFRAYKSNQEIVDVAASRGIETDLHTVSSRRWHFNNHTLHKVPTCEEVRAYQESQELWYRAAPVLHLVAAE